MAALVNIDRLEWVVPSRWVFDAHTENPSEIGAA
jgi:hypothetical protein